ncbi:hypothetical protein [Pseudoduganella violaceinigra]|uniref:hypothetical protein n=1 Tax=Pseudoduganella violaceinigra TaxID=246602 RepID=UPI0012B5136A|nr:hypothetical protein [Pseudoduganella violaceinigra]
MFKKLFAAFSAKSKTRADAPYGTEELNTVHNMLFSDDVGHLFGDAPDARVVQAIAQDPNEESRVRLLAAQWLRANGHAPAAPEVLGVVIEVPLEESMDTLAAYADGRVRYINASGRTAVFEGAPSDVAEQAKILVATAIPAFFKAAQQKPAYVPGAGQLRFTFLSQDGNRVTEGFFSDVVRDELAKPVLEQGQRLLDLVVKQGNAQ